ncbi:YgiQ family radical SAM protein [Thiobacillus sp.]|uniref:YgiQ family radical SAM protein n=1 Tax=Thiobacillus sp. TaxID=924 RepID=UPI0017E04B49|nr:YgiQ family radical SAM protein [Thiobacillus sp.]MBC2730629.1 YgiQ family radical SAM protein [Thiobacillus sp.]MBC2739366.1 YgiQ family radical SAM protein [Thiobacillus sp.]MBC2760349.1 YgiQ family radical SAM protein [Thiobacillus sp.]
MTHALFSHRKHWAARFGTAPFLPMSRAEMAALGWDACDVILVTGDAYIDHPSFGMALVGRLLEAQGYRVGIISQPDWHSADAFRALGQPTLYFGVTAGNMDSMVNRYTSDRKIRSDDAYTPDAAPNKRPDRAVTVYAQRCREAFPGTPVIIGSIEASLRRIAHYDYWSDTVRRSVLPDSKADLLIFGNAERALLDVTHRLAKGEKIGDIRDVRGTGFMVAHDWKPEENWIEVLSTELDTPGAIDAHVDPYAMTPSGPTAQTPEGTAPVRIVPKAERLAAKQELRARTVVRLPDYDQVKNNPVLYAHASRVFHLESNPGNARAMRQAHGERDVWLNPPPIPLSTPEMDAVYDLPYARAPHPSYGDAKIPAWEMIRFSVNIMRGCFGGCTFCSITEHEGRIIQSRSEDSVIKEIEAIRDKTPGFTGVISDLGGPTANMYRMACKSKKIEHACRRLSCVFPDICDNLNTDHTPLIHMYRRARALPGIKKILISSGLRYDLAVRSPEYVKELVQHHVGGYLKIAPEHTEAGPLSKMMKPGMGAYDRFKEMFEAASKAVGKKQYLIPYFIAAHPGTTDEDMLNLALWLKKHDFRLDQVQTFLPTPMALATAMYHTEKNPLKKVLGGKAEAVSVVKQGRTRRLHKAFLRYHDADNWPLLREALKDMGREDLIGNSKKHLIPSYQPAGTGKQPEGTRTPRPEGGRAKPTSGKPGSPKPHAAQPAPAKAGADKSGAAKPTSGKPAPANRGRPPQVPKHPLSQRRGGGKSR